MRQVTLILLALILLASFCVGNARKHRGISRQDRSNSHHSQQALSATFERTTTVARLQGQHHLTADNADASKTWQELRESILKTVEKPLLTAAGLRIYIADPDRPVPESIHPNAGKSSAKTFSAAGFGQRLTKAHLEEAMSDSLFREAVGTSGLAVLVHLIETGSLVQTQDYMQHYVLREKLRNSTMRAHSLREADFILVYECNELVEELVQEEDRLLARGHIKRRIPRLIACGCSPHKWYPSRKAVLQECMGDDAVYSGFKYGFHKTDDASETVMLPYITDVHPGGHRLSDSAALFDHPRHLLLSFEGSIASSRPVHGARFKFVTGLLNASYEAETALRNGEETPLTAIAKQVAAERLPSRLFFADYADGVPSAHVMGWRRHKKSGHMETHKMTMYGVYGNSYFCLNPPGDNLFRRAVWDSMLSGCIPVLYTSQAVHGHLFDAALWQFGSDFVFDQVFWLIDPEDPKDKILEDMLAGLVNGEVERRRKRIRAIVDFLAYSFEPDEIDAFVLGLGLLHGKLGENRADS